MDKNILYNTSSLINKDNQSTNIRLNSTINNQHKKHTKSLLPENINIPIINKAVDTLYIFCLSISIIILALIIILICFLKKRRRKKMKKDDNMDMNRINFSNSQKKQDYNRIQNTSQINNIGVNQDNLSELKVYNLKNEIKNVVNSNSGSSSGRRKRQSKKLKNQNLIVLEGEGEKEKQNEIKEQIKQLVINDNNTNE